MFYVYLIQSEKFPNQRYVGYSTDLKQRLADHNAGYSKHTAKNFEMYLKSGSGQAFANKRLWQQ